MKKFSPEMLILCSVLCVALIGILTLVQSSSDLTGEALTPARISWMMSQCGDGIYNDWETNERCPEDCPHVEGCFDTDNDGLNDDAEEIYGTDLGNVDSDGDGLMDGSEVYGGTDPLSIDSDGDGIPDRDELIDGSDPRVYDHSETCSETDSGDDPLVAGTTSGGYWYVGGAEFRGGSDYCDSSLRLREYKCMDESSAYYRTVTCGTVEPGYVCVDGACVSPEGDHDEFCTETDGGDDPLVAGTTSGGFWEVGGARFEGSSDYCDSSLRLREYKCTDDSTAYYSTVTCGTVEPGYVCVDGACVPPSGDHDETCSETDGGNDPLVKGTTAGGFWEVGGARFEEGTDYCVEPDKIKEYMCTDDSSAYYSTVTCGTVEPGYVCIDGACVPPEGDHDETCSETDSGRDPLVAGTTSGGFWEVGGAAFHVGSDYCDDAHTVREYMCTDDGTAYYGTITCGTVVPGYVCVDGACVPPEGDHDESCSETDGGFDPLVKGTTAGGFWEVGGARFEEGTDYCETSSRIKEYMCTDDSTAYYSAVSCGTIVPGYICVDGACVPPS